MKHLLVGIPHQYTSLLLKGDLGSGNTLIALPWGHQWHEEQLRQHSTSGQVLFGYYPQCGHRLLDISGVDKAVKSHRLSLVHKVPSNILYPPSTFLIPQQRQGIPADEAPSSPSLATKPNEIGEGNLNAIVKNVVLQVWSCLPISPPFTNKLYFSLAIYSMHSEQVKTVSFLLASSILNPCIQLINQNYSCL